MRANRPIFRRRGQYVAVRPIRLSANDFVQPGEDVSHLKEFHLRNLYRRRRIGFKGDAWTTAMLEDQGTFARPERVDPDRQVEQEVEQEAQKQPEGSESTEHQEGAPKDPAESGEAEGASPETVTETPAVAGPPKPVKDGSQYTIEGVDGKFTSAKKALAAWEAKHKAPVADDDFLA